jgi:hypothetical protein
VISAAAFHIVLLVWLALGVGVFVTLLFVTAPYGRHARPGWGPTMPARVGWIVMELPAVALMAWLFATSPRTGAPSAIIFLLLWELHYLQRTFVFPALARDTCAHMPVVIVALAFGFSVVNGFLQGEWLFRLGPALEPAWLLRPQFVIGAVLFLTGLAVNWHADAVLRRLRAPGGSGYRIPRGGLFELVSCPNYLGEIIEWTGWAVATWSLAGLAFALWTAANLIPRALAHQRWYRVHFPDYPRGRTALVPYLL